MKILCFEQFGASAGMVVLERTWSLVTGLQSGISTMYGGGIRYLHWGTFATSSPSVAAGLWGGTLNFTSLVDRLDLLLSIVLSGSTNKVFCGQKLENAESIQSHNYTKVDR